MSTQAKINKSVAVKMSDLFKTPTNPLRAKENPVDIALAANAVAIRKALDMGYSLRAIVLTLRDAGLPASPKTISKHLRKVVLGQNVPAQAPVAQTAPKKPAARKAASAAMPSARKRGATTAATQKVPAKRGIPASTTPLARRGKKQP